jgi:hypothetical protein
MNTSELESNRQYLNILGNTNLPKMRDHKPKFLDTLNFAKVERRFVTVVQNILHYTNF